MSTAFAPDDDTAWRAFAARDRAWDGRFLVGVKTTGIYCKPSCPARHPKRENVSFHPDPASARAAWLGWNPISAITARTRSRLSALT